MKDGGDGETKRVILNRAKALNSELKCAAIGNQQARLMKSVPRPFVPCGFNAGRAPPLKLPACGAQKIRAGQSPT